MVLMMSPLDRGSGSPGVAQLARETPRRFWRKPWFVAALVVLGVIAAIYGMQSARPPSVIRDEPVTALTVTTVTAAERPMKSIVTGVGTVVAWQELTVGTEASGLKVIEVLVDEGDNVKAGQVLARVDASVLKAQLRAQEARVLEARSSVTVAQNNLKRAEELVSRSVVSPATLDDRKSAADTAAARLTAAIAARDELASKVAQTEIVAPTDGHISARKILLGDVVSSGTEAFNIIRDNRLELNAQIGEADLANIVPGQQVNVVHDGVGTVVGTVRQIAPIVDAKSRLGTVHIALPAESGLRLGMYARAEITLDSRPALALPESAIVWREGGAFVFVVTPDGHVAERAVDAGMRQAGWIEVRKGLTASDAVVASGAGFLHDGDRVKVTTATGG
jgi:RND family efflux transporter MFP subunit